MEGLPIIPMLAPQFRASTLSYDNITRFDFRTKVKEYILLHFQADPHAYDEAFRELSDMKFEANNPSATIESSCKMKRYFGQLCMIQKRFPMSAGQELETPFAWFDSLSDNRHPNNEITHGDIEFEKASVMFNIGAAHAQIAANADRETQDSIKNAFMHCQYAAYAFEQLKNERYEDIFYPSVDLDPQVVLFLEKLMLAQAQECLVQKSLLDNRSPIVIGKLSYWLYQTYEEMITICEDWNVNISERIQRVYIGICRIKSDLYATIAYLSMGDNAESETKKMGYRLQYYNISLKYMKNVLKIKGLTEYRPEFLPAISFLSDVITAKQSNADKENNFIYHERVPKEEELIEEMKKDGAMCKTKSLAFNPLDRSVCGDDIFGTLLPPTVLKSVSLYEEKKAELKRGVLQEVHHANEELEKFLNKAGYTDLRWILSENGKDSEQMFALPDMLLERNAELTAQPDAIPALLEKLRESCDTSRVAEAKLNTLIGKLRLIDLPRLKNDEGYILISKELDKLHEHLTNAKFNNVALNKAIAAHSSNLQILSSPLSEIRQKLLPKKSETATKSKEEQHLKKIIEKIEEMRNQRAKLLDQLEVELNQDDISKELLAQRDFSHEEIFKKELSKHDETIKYFRLNLMAQEKILHAFTEANADFCDERIVINKNSEDFNKQVMILVTAYDIFKDVSNKVADGEKFYRQLMQRCDQFAIPIHAMEDQFRSEIDKREREKREMEERMNAAKRQREAREALNDFGAPMHAAAQNKMYALGPVDSGHPRLRDFMDQYRNRSKLAPIQTDQVPQDYLPGPPSPTPSSINEFPISPSVRGSRAASIRDTPILSSQHSPNPQQYLYHPPPQQQPQYHPPPTSSPYQNHQFQHVPNPNPIQPSSSNSSLSTYSQQQYSQRPLNSPAAPFNQNPLANPISNYQHQYSHYQPVPPVQFQPAPPNYYPPTSQHQSVPQYNSNNVPPQVQNQHIPPPTSQYAPQFQTSAAVVNQYAPISRQNPQAFAPGNPAQFAPGSEVANPQISQPPMSSAAIQPTSQFAPINQQSPMNPPVSQFAPINQSSQIQAPNNSVPPTSQFAPTPALPGNPAQFQTSQFTAGSEVASIPQPPMPSATSPFAPQPSQNPPTSQFAPGNPPQFQTSMVPSAISQTSQFAPGSEVGNPSIQTTSQFGSQNQSSLIQTPKNSAVPPTSQFAPGSELQPTSQFAPMNQQNPINPPASQFAPGNPQQFQTSQFTPTSEVANPSIQPTSQFAPQHPSTPSQIQTPNNPAVSQFAPINPSSPFVQQQKPSSPYPPQPSTPLGFSSQPPKSTSPFLANSIQPNASSPWHNAPKQLQTSAWHHQQNQQQQQNQQAQNQQKQNNVDLLSDLLGDFNLQQPALQPSQHQKQSNPDFSQTTIAQKPAATVFPMQQQPLNLQDLTDPKKFEIGVGNAQKLEKRMLHHSIRSNEPLPKIDQSDPLNQINPFQNLPK